MHITERQEGDLARLRKLAAKERDAEQKDRLLVAAHAIAGRETRDIQEALARSRGFVQRWAYAYRDGGVDALRELPRGGSEPKLPRQREDELRARLDAGPRQSDGVCTLRGKDVQRILKEEFGVKCSLQAVYDTLHRLGYSCLTPRPRHENRDPEAQAKFRKVTPLFSGRSATHSGRTG